MSPRCIIRIDLWKAYDLLEWPFLRDIMHALGFPKVFTTLVMKCVNSVTFTTLIMESHQSLLKLLKRLGKGIIVIGYLSRCFNHLTESQEFRYHPRCKRNKITHLLFTNDLLLFRYRNRNSVHATFDAFMKFWRVLGLKANIDKCDIYFFGLEEQFKEHIKLKLALLWVICLLDIQECCYPLRNSLIRSVGHYGKSSVLNGLYTFWEQVFVLNKKLIRQVIQECMMWIGKEEGSRKAPISWEKVRLPKESDGLNIRCLRTRDRATLLK